MVFDAPLETGSSYEEKIELLQKCIHHESILPGLLNSYTARSSSSQCG
jgi:hypothetical protein